MPVRAANEGASDLGVGADNSGPYGFINQEIDDAVTSALRAHRDYIYEQHLELPIVF